MKLPTKIKIRDREISNDQPVYIIGEMACAHQGDIETAIALIDATVQAKADCIQLQIFDTDANMAPSAPTYETLKSLYISPAGWRQIVTHARKHNIHLSIFVYDEPSLELALDLEPDMLKLNSSELSNPKLLVGAAQSNLPFTLGTGASSLEEIQKALDIINASGSNQVILMHGVQSFPTSVEEANVKKITTLKNEFGGLVIYADHTSGDLELSKWIDIAAIGMGAELLEKHITLTRNGGIDSQAALEPEEFKQYVSSMRAAWSSLGQSGFNPLTENERRYRRFQKKSVVASKKLERGDRLTRENTTFLRAQAEVEGIAPIDFTDALEGRRLRKSVECFQQISSDDVE